MPATFIDAYRQAGGKVELVVFEDVGHSFANFPSAQADECIRQMAQFIADQLT
jgi:acetyl esterase/lipase